MTICTSYLMSVLCVLPGMFSQEHQDRPHAELVYIGWSTNGKVATGIKVEDSQNSVYFYDYKITDLITDKVVFAKFFTLGFAAFANGFAEETIQDETKDFRNQLQVNHIHRSDLSTFEDPNNVVSGSKHFAVITKLSKEGGAIVLYEVEMKSGEKIKKVTRQELTARNAQDVFYLFAALSPDKKRLCITVLEKDYSGEGEQRIYVFGSNLTMGL
jgi:hypothetical protein